MTEAETRLATIEAYLNKVILPRPNTARIATAMSLIRQYGDEKYKEDRD